VRRRIISIAAAGLMAVGAAAAVVVSALPASAAAICEQYGTVVVGNYIVQNNRWGTTATQCINTTSNGFAITQQDGVGNTSGAPVSYPSIYLGCHYSNCSPGSPLPARISTMGNANSSINVSFPSSGTWNSSYDIWLNADTNVSGVQDTEIMIWLNRQGNIQPIGSQTGTATIAGRTWAVWTGSNGANNVVSYLSSSAIPSMSFNVRDFILDTFTRGSQYGNQNWYLTSIQAGFEPWVGGVGLAVNSFSASIGGGGGDTQAPTTPGTPSTSGVTSSSVNLSWSASTDNVGVTGYDIYRAPGASGGTFASVGTSTGTTFTNSGLTANTTYRYQVRARDAAGNTSGFSAPVTVTTTGGGGGGGACSATHRIVNAWSGAFQGEVVVANTSSSTINGWTATLTFPSSITITQMWGGTWTQSGNTVTIRPLSYTSTINPSSSVTLGFIANTSGSSGATPSSTCTSP
jgi:chitodextrinase